jgi:hypothetical protein
MGEYVDERGISRYIDVPQNIYAGIASWKMQSGQKIVESGNAWDDTNIHRIAIDSVTLCPYGDSWQITGVNGYKIPKVLFADYVAPPPAQAPYSVNAKYFDMLGRSLADIKAQLGDVQPAFEVHAEYSVSAPNSGVYYYFQGDDGFLSGTLEWTASDSDTCTKVASRLGTIVNGFGETATIAGFTANLASATGYEMRGSAGTSYYVSGEKYAVVFLDNGRVLEINMDGTGDLVSPDSYVWLR